jgi:arginyl-tRNA--protein-N-Asp/Glu arginylyltransferase
MASEPDPIAIPRGAGGEVESPENPEIAEILRFLKEPEPCSYLPGREAVTEIRLVAGIDPGDYGALLERGYRRFGMILFRPACAACRACVPIRLPVDRFRPTRSQRRVIRRNRDVEVEAGSPQIDEERLALHRAFHAERTARVGWLPQEISEEDYGRIFVDNIVPTVELRYRVGGRLAAVAYIDVTPWAVNSIYCFHHPDFRARSLGTFDVLTEIGLARRLGRHHLYLGFLVAGCRSMEYKARFRPAEVLEDGAWRELEGEVGRSGS